MNKQTKLLTAVLAVGSLLLLSGCAKYKAIPLTQPKVLTDKKGLTLEHKVFTKQDCATYLGRKNVLKKGYQPIQLTITNNTDRSYTYSSSSLSLPIVPAEFVAKKVKFSSTGRIIGYSALALTSIAGIIFVGLPAAFFMNPLGLSGEGVAFVSFASFFGALGFPIAASVDGTKSHEANKELAVDFAEKAVSREGIIRPGQTLNGIVFVAKNNFKKDFTFTVNDLQNNKAVVLSSTSELINVK